MAGTSRRSFCTGAMAGIVGGSAVGCGSGSTPREQTAVVPESTPAPAASDPVQAAVQDPVGALRQVVAQAPIAAGPGDYGIPGPYPGRVVDVKHTGSVKPTGEGRAVAYERNQEAVRDMIARGMRELVGSDDDVQAWRHFFSPEDRVGIKVVPNGAPLAMSSPEIVLEIINGLQSAGVPLKNILVFDRYKGEFLKAGYVTRLPEGVHWDSSTGGGGASQIAIDGQRKGGTESKVSGYDPDVFRELPYCEPSADQTNDARFRSHLSNIVSKSVDKIISVPVLKDHRSAGVTICLKNMSHGSVNNVARSHIAPSNTCASFIPAMVCLPQIREKYVLQIVDGLVGVYEGGPGPWNKSFATWDRRSLLFATDPVAADQIAWGIIDAKRKEMGWPPAGAMGADGVNGIEINGVQVREPFHIRQPQYIQLAATLGLGINDLRKIKHEEISLA